MVLLLSPRKRFEILKPRQVRPFPPACLATKSLAQEATSKIFLAGCSILNSTSRLSSISVHVVCWLRGRGFETAGACIGNGQNPA